MYQAIYELQKEKMEDMKIFLLENFQDLHSQLKVLPLEKGSKEDLMKRISAGEEHVKSTFS